MEEFVLLAILLWQSTTTAKVDCVNEHRPCYFMDGAAKDGWVEEPKFPQGQDYPQKHSKTLEMPGSQFTPEENPAPAFDVPAIAYTKKKLIAASDSSSDPVVAMALMKECEALGPNCLVENHKIWRVDHEHTCSDKQRYLLQREDGSWHCLNLRVFDKWFGNASASKP